MYHETFDTFFQIDDFYYFRIYMEIYIIEFISCRNRVVRYLNIKRIEEFFVDES